MFENFTTTQKNLLIAIVAVILFVGSTSLSYSLFASKFGAAPLLSTGGSLPSPGSSEEETGPKTEACPLNGELHNKQARETWEKRRPLAVMIENSIDARPQSGVSYADVVYEAVAEGGITRFMAMFYCNSLQDIQVGPVRSARTYYLDWASEYDALYAHVGGANSPGPANALGQIIDYKMKDLNQFSIGFPTFWRDYDRLKKPDGSTVATEHTMYSTTRKLWDVGAKRNWTNVDETGAAWNKNFTPWKFKDNKGGGQTSNIEVHFWEAGGFSTDYNVIWKYDAACNCYQRTNGNQPYIDLDNKKQLMAKNVVVQVQRESHANDGYENNVHLLYATNGAKGAASGTAYIFLDGKVIKGKWLKLTRVAREKFVDETGKEVEFNKGQIWIQTVPEGSTVKF